jgi:hypothetical protein
MSNINNQKDFKKYALGASIADSMTGYYVGGLKYIRAGETLGNPPVQELPKPIDPEFEKYSPIPDGEVVN